MDPVAKKKVQMCSSLPLESVAAPRGKNLLQVLVHLVPNEFVEDNDDICICI